MTGAPDISRQVIGHRGLAAWAPENTLESIDCAVAHGLGAVEFDVMLTKDRQPILMHDFTLDRTTDGAGEVAAATLAEIAALDAGSWFVAQPGPAAGSASPGAGHVHRVPTLSQALAAVRDRGLRANIEIKARADAAERSAAVVLDTLRREWAGPAAAIVLSSFSAPVLAAVQAGGGGYPTALLVDSVPRDWRARLDRLGAGAVHVRHTGLRQTHARAVTAAGYGLRAFTVNDRATADRLFGWGVDAVFSDTGLIELAATR